MRAFLKKALNKPHRTFMAYMIKTRFNPGIGGIFLNPFYFARKNLYANIASISSYLTGKILDVGCGTKPYRHLFRYKRYDGLEIDTPKTRKMGYADFFYDGIHFPFGDQSYNAIICNQVLEHVFNPDLFLQEINRVLKKDGSLLLTVPFMWDEHEQPYDYGRYSSFGLRYLLEKNSFKILNFRKCTLSSEAIFQLIAGIIYKLTKTGSVYSNLFASVFLISPIIIFGIIISTILPRSHDLYLDNVILAQKI